MRARFFNKSIIRVLCIISVIGLFAGLAAIVYATDSTWPRIKEQGGFRFVDAESGDTWTVELPVVCEDGSVNNQSISFTSDDIRIENYEELITEQAGEITKKKVGRIVLDYKDKLILQPGSGSISLKPGQYTVDYDGGDCICAYPYIFLNKGLYVDLPFFRDAEDNNISYMYDFCVVGNKMVASYPQDWSLNENTNLFIIESDHYISDYASYSLIGRLETTWGTYSDKDFADFSNGSDTFTLTNAIGESKTYTIKVNMPWRLLLQGKKGYNLVSIRVDGETVVGAMQLSKYVGNVSTEIKNGKKVDFTISPYGENEGKIIDTITLIKEDGTEINSNVKGNTVSFEMPEGNVKIGSVSYRESDAPLFAINAVSSEYLGGKKMGSISFLVNNEDAVTAKSGDMVSLHATPKEHMVYEFDFSYWETEDIELSEEQRVSDTISFVMPDKNVSITAVFIKKGVPVFFVADPGNAVESLDAFPIDDYISMLSSTKGIPERDVYKNGSKISFGYSVLDSAYLFDKYNVTDQDGNSIPYELGPWQNVIFTIPETGVTSINVVAKFKAKEFSSIIAKPNDDTMGTVTASVNGSAITAAVLQDETVTLKADPLSRYKFVSWDIAYEDGSSVDFEISDRTSNPATFVVPDNGKGIIVTGNFELDLEQMSTECDMLSVALFDGDTRYIAAKEGTAYTITVSKGTDPTALSAMVLKLTASEYATIRKSGDTQDWPAEGKACGMVVNTPVIFTVTAEDGKTSQDYTVTITETKSSEKEITAVRLLDSSNNSIAEGVLSGDTWTITLPADIDPALASGIGSSMDVFMQIEYTGASVAQEGGYDDAGQTSWNTGTILCGVSVNSQKTFTVKAEDGSTKDYVIAISYTAPDAPTLTNGSAERTGERTAVVKFTSSQSGTYYYQVVEKGASSNVDTSKNGSTAVAGENTINLSNLTADARDIYIVVKNAAGAESIPYKIEIEAYSSQEPEPGSYRITVSTPKGGTLTTNVTTANKGDSIIVTVTPDSGYQMVEGSLTYTMAVAGGETVKISGNRFTMPECDVTITCRWEESSSGGGSETPQEPGITSFIVQGVSGAISKNSDTEYTITLLMPHGTDVTKLAPVISTYGNVSVSPASGKVQDFSSPVTYTVTLEDGTKLKYKVTVYVSAGSKADQMWDKLADPHSQTFWWDYALQQQIRGKYPKYW